MKGNMKGPALKAAQGTSRLPRSPCIASSETQNRESGPGGGSQLPLSPHQHPPSPHSPSLSPQIPHSPSLSPHSLPPEPSPRLPQAPSGPAALTASPQRSRPRASRPRPTTPCPSRHLRASIGCRRPQLSSHWLLARPRPAYRHHHHPSPTWLPPEGGHGLRQARGPSPAPMLAPALPPAPPSPKKRERRGHGTILPAQRPCEGGRQGRAVNRPAVITG